MGKTAYILVGLAAFGGATYALRKELPPSMAAAIEARTGLALQNGKTGPADNSGASKRTAESPPSKKGAPGAAPVNVATAALADMPVILSAPGTVEPLATVAIKPRVDGQVIEVRFGEGDMVQAGAVLYKLDDRLVIAQIKQAEATIARDQASLKDAVSISERRESLFVKRYASEASTETARQNVEVLKASIVAGQAQLEAQRTQLDYLTIRAPITGRTGSVTAKLGAFVRSADPLPLVTINQTKPIMVAFALPQIALQQIKSAMAAKALAKITVAGAKPLTVSGVLNFVDNQIDKTTGTVTGKVLVENADESLWPGLAVTVDLIVETRKSVVTVPASAVLPAQQGMIVWLLGADGKVAVRSVVQERVIGQTAFLSSGIKDGDRVITDGQLRLAPGMTVSVREPSSGRPIGAPPASAGGAGSVPAKSVPGGSAGGG